MPDFIDPPEQRWDAIVIGTGMGGATVGYALAKAGKRVLFCEKGVADSNVDGATRGDYAENFFGGRSAITPESREIFKSAGRCVEMIEDTSYESTRSFVPFIGSGAGGSSALYGMALERFFPADFEPRRHHPGASRSTLPDAWPISYEELAPYYGMAEELFRVKGGAQLSSGAVPPLSDASRELTAFLTEKGLHPYRLPLACEFVPGCTGCQGFLCSGACKNDSGRICLAPALSEYGAQLFDDCTAVKLIADESRVSGIVCKRKGADYLLEAKTIILASGALATPALLLTSANPQWPDGLANRSGLVGKNLMRHCIDLYAIFSKSIPATGANLKELALNDYYLTDSEKFGSIQSFGPMPPARMLVESMQEELADEHGRSVAALFTMVKPLLRQILDRVFTRTLVLATVMEDLPYAENRISVQVGKDGASAISIHYRLQEHDKKRVNRFRALMAGALSHYRFLLLKQAENNRRLAHVCGTCRFGNDPQTSVLDRNNKAHDLSNLYVVDASFFPSSGGTNPALTIAANALRVAEHIVGLDRSPIESARRDV